MKRIAVVAAILVCASMAAPARAATFEMQVPVLMYHRIACARPDGTYSSLFICPANFNLHMKGLRAAGWRSVTADGLAQAMTARICLPFKTMVISIDDGALDGYKNGAPILEANGLRATYYMVVGKVGDYLTTAGLQKPHFSWPQARNLVARAMGSATTRGHTRR